MPNLIVWNKWKWDSFECGRQSNQRNNLNINPNSKKSKEKFFKGFERLLKIKTLKFECFLNIKQRRNLNKWWKCLKTGVNFQSMRNKIDLRERLQGKRWNFSKEIMCLENGKKWLHWSNKLEKQWKLLITEWNNEY